MTDVPLLPMPPSALATAETIAWDTTQPTLPSYRVPLSTLMGAGPRTATASAAISGHRAVMPDGAGGVVGADPTAQSFQFAGITTGAVAAGALASLAEAGQTVTEPSWSWTPGAALYVGLLGVLTQAPPTTGWLQQVAVAVTATTILVQPSMAILRS